MTHFRHALTAVLLVGLLAAAPASAQVCAGRPGADVGNVLLGAGYSSANGTSGFDVGITGLGERAFGAATIGSISYDDFSGSTTMVGGSLGYQLSVGTSGRAQLCPTFSGALGFGPNDIEGTGVDASTRSVGAGVTWGFRATESADFALIPTIGAGVAYASVKLTDGVDELTESDSYGLIDVGLGIVLGRQFAATPFITIPVGLEGADPTIGLTISLSIGKRR